MHPTPYADIDKLLEGLLARIYPVLQARLTGLYLWGSLTTGDFDRNISDIDLLATTTSQMTTAEFEALRAMHRDFARDNPEWEDRLEVAYLPEKLLKTFRSEKSSFARISPGEPFHMRGEEALVEWLQDWYVVREYGVALSGLPPEAIIPPITQEEFAWATRRYATELSEWIRGQRDRKSHAHAILTMCRALHVQRMGQPASKKRAALWAQQALPEWLRLIQSALMWRRAWREAQIADADTHAETLRFVDFMQTQLTP